MIKSKIINVSTLLYCLLIYNSYAIEYELFQIGLKATPQSINIHGEVVGGAMPLGMSSSELPFYWHDGELQRLPIFDASPARGSYGIAYDINNSGLIVGGTSVNLPSEYPIKASYWNTDNLFEIYKVDEADQIDSHIFKVTDNDIILGESEAQYITGSVDSIVFLDMVTEDGKHLSPVSINNNGYILFNYGSYGSQRAYIYDGISLDRIESPTSILGVSINEENSILLTGYEGFRGRKVYLQYDNSEYLIDIFGDFMSSYREKYAIALNNNNQVLCRAESSEASMYFFWDPEDGFVNLSKTFQDFIPELVYEGEIVSIAFTDLNDYGQVVGHFRSRITSPNGGRSYVNYGFMMSPMIEPFNATAKMLPRNLTPKSRRKQIIGRIEFEGIAMPKLAPNQSMLLLIGEGEIEALSQELSYSDEDEKWYLKGFFDFTEVISNLPETSPVEVTLMTRFKRGQWVHGTDIVKVK